MIEYLVFKIGPLVFGLAGLILASYIYSTKKDKTKKLICPMKGHCDTVVGSQYSKFLGLPVELMGVLYYALIVLSYGLQLWLPELFGNVGKLFLTALTVGAFIFSLYLVSIQAFVLKRWCTWCLFSAGFSTLIFIIAVFGATFPLKEILLEYKSIIIFFHALSAAIGVGAATVTDVLFFKFLKDYRISHMEKSIMDNLSGVIWVALGLLIVTGLGLFLPESERFLASSKFITKMVAVAVVTVNGLFLNLIISPRITDIQFGKEADPKHEHHAGELKVMRKLAFAFGAISITSWYTIFLLGSLRSIPIESGTGILVYAGVLILAIVGSQFYDKFLIHKRKSEKEAVRVIKIKK